MYLLPGMEMRSMRHKWFGSVLGMVFLTACSGSGGSSNDDETNDEADAGEQTGDGDTSQVDGGGDGDADDEDGPVFPDESVTTQYWMRADMDVEMVTGVDSGTMTFSSYSLVALTRSKTGYEFVDLQCQVAASNGKCGEGSPFCGTLAAEIHEGQAFAPSRRTLSFDGSAWTSSDCAQAVGWKWSCTEDPTNVALPTAEDDPLVYSPAEGDAADLLPGVDLKITFDGPTFQEPWWCVTAVAQKVDVIYSGTLVKGELALTGVVTDNGSEQSLLNDYCGTFDTPTPTGPGTLRLIEKTFDGGNDASTWTCPSLADFEQAFATK